MDQSNRRKMSKRNNKHKGFPEVNGNKLNSSSYKVENARRHKQTRDCCTNESQDHGRISDVLPNYVPLHGQRLFTAMSDPAVCGYPVSLSYPYDPIAVPLGYPMYHPPQYPHRVPCKDAVHSSRKQRLRNNHEKFDQSKDTFQTVDEYTSLPPVNLQDIESDQQRRFSDPGLGNNSGSEEDSLSNEGSSASWFEESQVAHQIESLVEENKRLSKELKDTQLELQELKLEVATIVQMQSSCEPGFITDLVREIHEATKVKEDALLARLRVFSESIEQNKHSNVSSVQPSETVTEELSKRMARLEDQMKTILAHNSIEVPSQEELVEVQKENLKLQQELKSAVDAKNLAEANVTKYERLFNSITKKLPNGLVLEDKAASPSLETNESLSSSLGSGSLHSPQVTMSGPVTDL